MYLKKLILIVFFALVALFELTSQVNISVGYNASFGSFSNTNELIDAYNSDPDLNLEQGMKGLYFLHGISVGVRYRMPSFGLALTWNNAATDREAIGLINADEAFSKELFFNSSGLSLGLENYFGKFGVGASIDRNSYAVKTSITNIDTKRTVTKQNNWSSNLYLIWEVQQSDLVSLVLEPYIVVPWSGYDLTNVANELNATATGEEDSLIFGLRIVFFNGRQN